MICDPANNRIPVPECQPSFEELLLEISAQFMNLSVGEIDDAIESAQRRICETLDIEFSALWRWFDRNSTVLSITHLHSPDYGPSTAPGEIDASTTFPWVFNKLLSGETFVFSTEDLPDEAQVDKESREFYGIQSSVDIPLVLGNGPIIGILTFDSIRKHRRWTKKEVHRLELIANIFVNALARGDYEADLLEGKARLALAAESAEAGMWELDCGSSLFWSTDRAKLIFGYSETEEISLELFEQSIVPQDLELVRGALAHSFASGDLLVVEYRIHRGDEIKWICSRGRPYFQSDGTPERMFGISVDISERKQLEETLRQHVTELENLKDRAEQENYYLRGDLQTELGLERVIGQSREFRSVLASVQDVAETSATVLLLGETGTGKGVLANAIHKLSDRASRPFVTVNCAALPGNLIESELFGRSKGAFTGADAMQMGRFEIADKGTIFLDEIGEMPLELQAKLLRVLQEGEFERLGSPTTLKVDVRVVAATGRNLVEDVQEGRFREDLYYRLNVFPITIPPLSRRTDDIPLLVQFFIEKYNRKHRKNINRVPKATMEALKNRPWPGNVRELEHLIERSVIICKGDFLAVEDTFSIAPQVNSGSFHEVKDLESMERDYIASTLELANWKIEGADGAATLLGLKPSTLRFKLKKLGLKRPVS